MTTYCYCKGDIYGAYHSEMFLGRDIAEALLRAGDSAVALGAFGADSAKVRPGPEDTLYVMGGLESLEDVLDNQVHLLSAGQKILYTNHVYPRLADCTGFDVVLVECAAAVPAIQSMLPSCRRVEWCPKGISLGNASTPTNDPYPHQGRNLFFAGRLNDSFLVKIAQLLGALDSRYHLWIATQSVMKIRSMSGIIDTALVPASLFERYVVLGDGGLSIADMGRLMSAYCGPSSSRVTVLGSLPYGSFDGFYRHSFATLEFGYPDMSFPADNSKVLTALAAGGRIVGDAYSGTNYLVRRHGGVIVPHGDVAAMADVLDAMDAEPLEVQARRVKNVHQMESWDARVPLIRDLLGPPVAHREARARSSAAEEGGAHALLRCLACGRDFVVQSDIALSCAAGHVVPVESGVPIFASEHDEGFDKRWELHPAPQATTLGPWAAKTCLGDLNNKLVLDAGCGIGRFTKIALSQGAQVVGVDISPSALKGAQANASGATFVQADLLRLPFADETFDAAFSIGVLHHTSDPAAAFREVARTVKRGGDLAVWVYPRWHAAELEPAVRMLHEITRAVPSAEFHAICKRWAKDVKGLYSTDPSRLMPLSQVLAISGSKDDDEQVSDTFDWHCPQYRTWHTIEELRGWFDAAGFDVTWEGAKTGAQGRKR